MHHVLISVGLVGMIVGMGLLSDVASAIYFGGTAFLIYGIVLVMHKHLK